MKQPQIRDIYLYKYFKKLMFISLWISGIALVVEYSIPLLLQSANEDILSIVSGSEAVKGVTSFIKFVKYSINPIILTACVIGYIAAHYLVYKSPDMVASIKPTGLYILCPACLAFLLFGDLYAFLVTLGICITAIKLLSDPHLQYDEDAEWQRRREAEKELRELEKFDDDLHRDDNANKEDEEN